MTKRAILVFALIGCGELGVDEHDLDGKVPPADLSVAAATFMMGCNSSIDTSCSADEYPYHQVKLHAFYIERTEVTQAAYANCIKAGACTTPAGTFNATSSLPVVQVSWDQAHAYCAWAGKRLP